MGYVNLDKVPVYRRNFKYCFWNKGMGSDHNGRDNYCNS
nr:MAG TPA: hypothetical protein [Caudoviricetes sp.]DAZ79874.1 MAG TPA: hypothetical protein [Caudoviricetes sp.]